MTHLLHFLFIVNLHLGAAARSEVDLSEWLQLPVLGDQGVVSEGGGAVRGWCFLSLDRTSAPTAGVVPVRQLLLWIVQVVADEEPLCVLSLAVGHHAAVQQRYRRKPEEKRQMLETTTSGDHEEVGGRRSEVVLTVRS